MSRKNVDVVQRWIAAYNRRDFEGLIELTDPDFEFRSIFVAIESDFRGYERFPYAYFKTLDEAYDHFEVIPSELIDAGAAVLLFAHANWRGKASGAQGERPIATAFWLRAGKAFRAETFADRTQALDVLGLSEGEADFAAGVTEPVSHQNVERTRELVEAVARQDASRLVELTDPEVEWHSLFAAFGEGGVYRGHDGMRRYMRDLGDAWEFWRFHYREEDVLAIGDLVLVIGHFRYRGRDSGFETTSPPAGVLVKFRQGRAVYMRSWRDPEETLEAAARQEEEVSR